MTVPNDNLVPLVPDVWQDQVIMARRVPGRGVCGIQPFVYTHGLLVNLRFDGLSYSYDARYCFPYRSDAFMSLLVWNGEGDPPGDWVKEKVSERSNPNMTV